MRRPSGNAQRRQQTEACRSNRGRLDYGYSHRWDDPERFDDSQQFSAKVGPERGLSGLHPAVPTHFYTARRYGLPNQRMKLSHRGGHFWWNGFFLIVAAPARSLCAIR